MNPDLPNHCEPLADPFPAQHNGETWTLTARWVSPSGTTAYYDGHCFRAGTRIDRTFSPDELD